MFFFLFLSLSLYDAVSCFPVGDMLGMLKKNRKSTHRLRKLDRWRSELGQPKCGRLAGHQGASSSTCVREITKT